MDEFSVPNRSVKLFARDEQDDDAITTPWSLVHFLSGSAMKSLGFSTISNFLFHAGYEYKDYLDHQAKVRYNSPINSAGDQMSSLLGYYAATKGDYDWLVAFVGAFLLMLLLRKDVG